ncbi:MAG: hypothetical protein LBF26_01285 [Puniceicoccales bacterium]|jgi:hypothetical protein|nr:hypothetical protein [Puniceicoccales bacterium]
MPIKLLTLRQVFDRILTGKNAIDYDALLSMIEIEDSFNDGIYTFHPTISTESVARDYYIADPRGNLILYSMSTDADGKAVFSPIGTLDEFIPSSVDLYLRRNIDASEDDDSSEYVHIYELNKLDSSKFRNAVTQKYLPHYRDTASRVAGILYAMCCYQKKIMQLHINDIEAVNREQRELNRISSLISVIQNDLREKDTGIDDVAARHSSTIYADIVAFFIQRGLLDTMSTGSKINSNLVALLKCIINGNSIETTITPHDGVRGVYLSAATAEDLIAAFAYGEDGNPGLFSMYESLRRVCVEPDTATVEDLAMILFGVHDVPQGYDLVVSDGSEEYVLSSAPLSEMQESEVDLLGFLDFFTTRDSGTTISWQMDSEKISIQKGEILARWNILNTASFSTSPSQTADMLAAFATTYRSCINQDESELPDNSDVISYILNGCTSALYVSAPGSTTSFAVGGRSLGLVEAFRAWTQFQVLVKHYDTFFDTGPAGTRLLPEDVSDSGNLNLDVFSPVYWVKASDSENNAFKGVIGLGDHWVFDPRIRYKSGEFVENSTSESENDLDALTHVYFKGFSAIDTGRSCENLGKTYNSSNGESGSSVPVDEHNYSPEYSVSWFGKNPPSSASDFENGIAGILSRSYGEQHFINRGFFSSDDEGRMEFTDAFRDAMQNGSTQFQVTYCGADVNQSEGDEPFQCFYVHNFGGQTTPGPNGAGTSNSISISDYKSSVPSADYWAIPKVNSDVFDGAYATYLKGGIENIVQDVKLNAEHCGMWADTIRIYTDQVNNDTTGRTTAMQMVMQLSQQDLSTASNLMKAIFRLYAEITGNVRL